MTVRINSPLVTAGRDSSAHVAAWLSYYADREITSSYQDITEQKTRIGKTSQIWLYSPITVTSKVLTMALQRFVTEMVETSK